jgi:hypothetical protein
MRSPEKLRTASSHQRLHLSVLINQPLLLKGTQSTQHLCRVALANVLKLVRGDRKLTCCPSLAHVIKDVRLAALQLVSGLLHRLSSQDALTIAVMDPAVVL